MIYIVLNDIGRVVDAACATLRCVLFVYGYQAALQQLLQRWTFWKNETVSPIFPDSDPASYPSNFKGVYNGSWMPWIPPTGQ